jgi:tetratricopeptide (TPR) repeat protein
MAGTLNHEAYNKLKQGRRLMTYPVTAGKLQDAAACFRSAIALDAGKSFEECRDQKFGYPKAWGHLGYSVLTAWIEGWESDQAKALQDADDFTGIAISQEHGKLDYDTHWDRAFFLQMKGSTDPEQFNLAVAEYETAMDLNHVDTNLLLEASESYVSAGRHDDALALLDKAGRSICHDWYRWDRAWVYYFKARSDPAFLDLAISEIRSMYWNPGEPQYMYDVQLLLAAIYAQKADKPKADCAMAMFQKEKPGWHVKDEYRARPLKHKDDQKHLLVWCKEAGLPDPEEFLSTFE